MPLIIDCKQVKTEIELQMSRVSSYDRYWTLRVSDKRSHTVIAEIEISEKEFSNFMSTAISAATGTIFQSNNHGKYSEVKRFEVEVPENARSYSDDSAWAAFMEAERVKCEAEGWRLDIDPLDVL